MIHKILFGVVCLFFILNASFALAAGQLAGLKKDQKIADFRVANVYSDGDGSIVGAKFFHIPTGSTIFLLQIETVPQVFMWIDEPSDSDKGLAHSLEHLVYGKGIKGRYARLLTDMKLGSNSAFTAFYYNAYHFYSGGSTDDLLEQLHAWMDTLFRPDFSDVEAEREFYNFGETLDPKTGKRTLVEKGTVYNEMNAQPGISAYYFALRKQVYGKQNPLGFNSGGVPEAMRGVTPADIREFHAKHYSLGPQTGFIFALAPDNDVFEFLRKTGRELQQFTFAGPPRTPSTPGTPRYPITPAASTEIGIYPFPGKSQAEPGQILFGWKAQKTESLLDVNLLQQFTRALARGEQSVLHKAIVDSKTRVVDSGATSVEASVSLDESPWFPAMEIYVDGVPGNRIAPALIEQLRAQVKKSIAEISAYPAHSPQLQAFNRLVSSHVKATRRFESVRTRNAPEFGLRYTSSAWKNLLDELEMDPAFNRSLTEEKAMQAMQEKLDSGENIWTGLIQKFGLLETPYAAASMPSPELLEREEKERQERVAAKIKLLMQHYNTTDDQQALKLFEQDEAAKTKEVETIEAKVPRPKFMGHPPMTQDDGIHYQQSTLLDVPVITTTFDRPPTIDLGLNFSLRRTPRKYYKYLPLLPRFVREVGLKEGEQALGYSDVLEQLERDIYRFTIDFETDELSHRADFSLRASAANTEEFRTALRWMERLLKSNNLDLANADRLRDIVEQAISADDSFTKQWEEFWITDPAWAFRYQDDVLYLALKSTFTQAHWHSRMKWMLHPPVPAEEIDRVIASANQTLSSWDKEKIDRQQMAQKLQALKHTGLEGELVEYWKKSLPSFADAELVSGLHRLTNEVQEDLKTGPKQTIQDLKDLQRLVIVRSALHLDMNLNQATLNEIKPDLLKFLGSIPVGERGQESGSEQGGPIVAKLRQRYPEFQGVFPYYVGFVNLEGVNGNTIFTARFPGYEDLDHASLLRSLSSRVRAGGGPQSLYMKTWEAGLAYGNGIRPLPARKMLYYYADRSPSISALVQLVNSLYDKLGELGNDSLADYVLSQTFAYSRSMLTFTERARSMAADLRDGIKPEQIRRYAEAVLKLRSEPNFLMDLMKAAPDAADLVLLKPGEEQQQKAAQTIFFMIGPESMLAQTEQQLSIPRLLRLWPSDYWIQ